MDCTGNLPHFMPNSHPIAFSRPKRESAALLSSQLLDLLCQDSARNTLAAVPAYTWALAGRS